MSIHLDKCMTKKHTGRKYLYKRCLITKENSRLCFHKSSGNKCNYILRERIINLFPIKIILSCSEI